MALSTISAGIDTGFSTKLNNNFRAGRILQIYTGTGLDVSLSGTTTSTHTKSVELTAVASSSLGGADYLVLEAIGYAKVEANLASNNTGTGYVTLLIETKPIGGSYSTSLAETVMYQFGIVSASDGGERNYTVQRILSKWTHTLTASEKSAGVQVKVTVKAYVTSDDTGSAIFTLSQLEERTAV